MIKRNSSKLRIASGPPLTPLRHETMQCTNHAFAKTCIGWVKKIKKKKERKRKEKKYKKGGGGRKRKDKINCNKIVQFSRSPSLFCLVLVSSKFKSYLEKTTRKKKKNEKSLGHWTVRLYFLVFISFHVS